MRDLKVKWEKNMEISSDQLNSILREREREEEEGERERESVWVRFAEDVRSKREADTEVGAQKRQRHEMQAAEEVVWRWR